jgi:hypothetical protein
VSYKGAPYPPVNGREPCRAEPELFFPEQGGNTTSKEAREACSYCWIQEQCLAYGLTHAVAGIWGGKSANERRAIAEEQGIQVVPMVQRADQELIARAGRRGTPPEVIASFVGITSAGVSHVLAAQRRAAS